MSLGKRAREPLISATKKILRAYWRGVFCVLNMAIARSIAYYSLIRTWIMGNTAEYAGLNAQIPKNRMSRRFVEGWATYLFQIHIKNMT